MKVVTVRLQLMDDADTVMMLIRGQLVETKTMMMMMMVIRRAKMLCYGWRWREATQRILRLIILEM